MTVKQIARKSLRAERAEVTRRRIAESARQLFAANGYAATTLESIALEAGVAVQTVYAVYRSKAGILRTLRESVLHDQAAEALFERAILEPRPVRTLELLASSIRQRWEHGHDIVGFHTEAGRADATVRREVQQVVGARRAGLARIAALISGSLAGAIDREQAMAILDAMTLPEVYQDLVVQHGWKPDQYEAWLAATLCSQLLAKRSPSSRR
jgi:AcrR family transcriptional regulator